MNTENLRAARLEAELLFLLFLGLKLSGHIDWSWWWVFAPIWGIVSLVCLSGAFYAVIWPRLDRGR